jgi:hypothetical protein
MYLLYFFVSLRTHVNILCSSTNWRVLQCNVGYLIFVIWIADERSFTKTYVKKVQCTELTVRRTSNFLAAIATYQCKSMQENEKICNSVLTLSHIIYNDFSSEFCNRYQESNSTIILKVETHPFRADYLILSPNPYFSAFPNPLFIRESNRVLCLQKMDH